MGRRKGVHVLGMVALAALLLLVGLKTLPSSAAPAAPQQAQEVVAQNAATPVVPVSTEPVTVISTQPVIVHKLAASNGTCNGFDGAASGFDTPHISVIPVFFYSDGTHANGTPVDVPNDNGTAFIPAPSGTFHSIKYQIELPDGTLVSNQVTSPSGQDCNPTATVPPTVPVTQPATTPPTVTSTVQETSTVAPTQTSTTTPQISAHVTHGTLLCSGAVTYTYTLTGASSINVGVKLYGGTNLMDMAPVTDSPLVPKTLTEGTHTDSTSVIVPADAPPVVQAIIVYNNAAIGGTDPLEPANCGASTETPVSTVTQPASSGGGANETPTSTIPPSNSGNIDNGNGNPTGSNGGNNNEPPPIVPVADGTTIPVVTPTPTSSGGVTQLPNTGAGPLHSLSLKGLGIRLRAIVMAIVSWLLHWVLSQL